MKHIPLFAFTFVLHLSLHAASVEILPGPFADVRGNLVVETIPFDAAIDKPMRWVFSDPGTMRPARIVKDIDLSALALYPDAPSTNFIAYIDADASGSYTPGEPFGVSNGRYTQQIELSNMSAITPRVRLWDSMNTTNASDRGKLTGTDWLHDPYCLYDRFEKTTATVPKNRVRVVRYAVDKFPVYKIGVDAGVVLEKDFEKTSRDFLHEGDFLADGDLDIDWANLYTDVVDWWGAQAAACEVTNVTYLIVYNWDKSEYMTDYDTNTQVKANATLVTRRFEKTRTVPTPVLASSLASGTTFSFRIDNEDPWASQFGTTYTAFKVKVLNGSTNVWNSGILRLPARDKNGIYTANFSNISNLSNVSNLSWRVAVYNAKFKTDTLMEMDTEGDPFSSSQTIGDQPPPEPDPSGTVDLAIYPGPYASTRGPVVIEQERNPFRYRTPQKWTIPDCRLRRPPVITHSVFCSDTNAQFIAYIDADASGSYTPGEPFGVSNEQSNNPNNRTIDLTDMSAITPRVNLWNSACDRSAWTGTNWLNIGSALYDRFEKTEAKYPKNRVRVVRYTVDKFPVYRIGVDAGVVLEKDFEETSRDFLHEGDFLADGDLDIDWKNLYSDVVTWRGTQMAACEVTNVTYLIVYNWDAASYRTDDDTNAQVKANATLVTRRFEKTRTVPTAVSAYSTPTNAVFSWKVENEEPWASQFGTTYTAFKVKVINGSTEVWNSGIIRLPASDKNGIYTANFSNISNLSNVSNLSWRVAVYNAKFKTDTLMAMETEGDPFSPVQQINTP